MSLLRFLGAAFLSGLFHTAVIYSFSAIPELPKRDEKIVRIDIGKIALVRKEEKKKPSSSKGEINKVSGETKKKEIRRKQKKKKKIVKRKPRKVKEIKKTKRASNKKIRKNVLSRNIVKKKRETYLIKKAVEEKKESRYSGIIGKPSNNTATSGNGFIEKRTVGNSVPVKSVAYATGGGVNYGEIYRKLNLVKIRKLVQESLSYPYVARRMGWEGKVLVELILTPDGCASVRLKEGTGYRVLDENALDTVKRLCGKFPKPTQKVSLVIPIVYKLN